ncbi:MAG: Gfo/Idh/MocA family oxidoreductase [Clostridia bacterium]|nr:Gfo/Idh/MocA family oxidoreductase [Clostridia bacterium]
MSGEEVVRLGIIGIGNIGTAHANSVYGGHVPGTVLTALCDSDPARARELQELYPDVAVFEDAEELFASGTVDAVVIATPHYSHPTLAIRAFESGLHVLSEKPIGVSCAKAREMVAAAKASGKRFAVMFNQRTNKLFIRARELVQGGALGELKRSVWIITNWYRKQSYYDSGNWRATWSGEGGGVLMNQAPHNLDLWQWICGMPVQVQASCDVGKYHDIEVEDDATLFVRYENGATGVFITSTGDYPGTNRLEITGTRGKIVIEGGTLTLQTLSVDERTYCFGTDPEKPTWETAVIEDEKINGHRAVLANFARSIRYGDALIARGEEGLNELTLCNAAYLSAWTGESVSLPMDDEAYQAALEERVRTGRKAQLSKSRSTHNGEYLARWNTNW